MEWWQILLNSVILGLGGILLGSWLQKRAQREERASREKAERRSAIEALLAEIEAALALAVEAATPFPLGASPPFPTDAWSVHKGRILWLPAEVQGVLHQAYVWIGKANRLAELNLFFSPISVGHYDREYMKAAKEVQPLLEKAKHELMEWLK